MPEVSSLPSDALITANFAEELPQLSTRTFIEFSGATIHHLAGGPFLKELRT